MEFFLYLIKIVSIYQLILGFLLVCPFISLADNYINDKGERCIVIVTASYNNSKWYQWNLDSVFNQQYDNWRLIYVDDCSPDGTCELVQAYVKEKRLEHRVTLIRNTIRRKALANLYYAIWSCHDREIVIILDGDDRLAHDQVFSYLNAMYADPAVWLTYGQFREHPSGVPGFCEPMPDWVVQKNMFRKYPIAPSHLRTFYAGLFKQIKTEDLFYNSDFFPMTYDLAMMFPMIEMAREGHFRFIPEVLLDYNTANPINDHKVSKELQQKCDAVIRSRKPYDPIVIPFRLDASLIRAMKQNTKNLRVLNLFNYHVAQGMKRRGY
jgi:glycosyltransferase involved in cell wall biosynthesis